MAELTSVSARILDGCALEHSAGTETGDSVRTVTTTGHKYAPLPTGRHVIRLLRLKNDWESPIPSTLQFEFITAELSSEEQITEEYYAISYTWGADPGLAPVVLDGKQVLVPDSAEAALRGILDCIGKHDQWPMLPIWIDAVCINQEDMTEKQQQIGLMGRLYSQAKTVFVWLGLDDGTTMAAVRSFESLAREKKDFDAAGLVKSEREKSPLPTDVDQASLLSFLSCPWFTRLWVLQEVALSRDAVLVRGPRWMPWRTFQEGAGRLRDAGHFLVPALLAISFAAVAVALLHRRPKTLNGLLVLSFFYQTSNPHDKIYGLLGLVNYGDGVRNVIPDYQKPLSEVFREATWLAISSKVVLDQPLSLLLFSQHYPLPEDMLDSWPSWVPLYHKTISENAFADPLSHAHSRANGGSEAQHELDSSDAHVIKIRGVRISTIMSISLPSMGDGDLVDAFCKSFANADRPWQSIEAISLACSLVSGLYEGEKASMKEEMMMADFRSYLIELGAYTNDQALKETPKAAANLQGNAERFTGEIRRNPPHALVQLLDGSFARTRSFVKPGDNICILFGMDAHVLLRPVGDCYKMRGLAYVPGDMKGEYIQKLKDEGRLEAETVDFAIS